MQRLNNLFWHGVYPRQPIGKINIALGFIAYMINKEGLTIHKDCALPLIEKYKLQMTMAHISLSCSWIGSLTSSSTSIQLGWPIQIHIAAFVLSPPFLLSFSQKLSVLFYHSPHFWWGGIGRWNITKVRF